MFCILYIFVPFIVIKLCNVNQQNAYFTSLYFNPILDVFSIFRKTYVRHQEDYYTCSFYGIFMQSVWQVEGSFHLLDCLHKKHTIKSCMCNSLPDDEHILFEACERHHELNTYSMELSPSWKTNRFAASQIPRHFMEPEGSLPHSQVPVTCLYPDTAQSSP
jgi:hypothetical protein